MARSNIRVNGQNLEDLNEDEGGCPSCAFVPPFLSVLTSRSCLVPSDTEPFDEGFDRHIWSLADQSLRWDLQIGRERRTKPEELERQMRELLASQGELDAGEAAALEEVEDEGLDAPPKEDRTCISVCPTSRRND